MCDVRIREVSGDFYVSDLAPHRTSARTHILQYSTVS